MIIGLLRLEFALHGNDSLKAKRNVARSLKQKLRNKFNVAVAEVEAQESHVRLVLAAVTPGQRLGGCGEAPGQRLVHGGGHQP